MFGLVCFSLSAIFIFLCSFAANEILLTTEFSVVFKNLVLQTWNLSILFTKYSVVMGH